MPMALPPSTTRRRTNFPPLHITTTTTTFHFCIDLLLLLFFLLLLFQQQQQPVSCSRSDDGCITDTLFLLDSSGSVRHTFDQYRQFVKQLIQQMPVSAAGHHVGFTVYSGRLRQFTKLALDQGPQEKTKLLERVDALPHLNGVTATGVALDVVTTRELPKRRKGPGMQTNLVVMTDGFSYDPVAVQSAHLHSLPDVRTFAVSMDDIRVDSELKVIAGGNAENVFVGNGSQRKLLQKLLACPKQQQQQQQQKGSGQQQPNGPPKQQMLLGMMGKMLGGGEEENPPDNQYSGGGQQQQQQQVVVIGHHGAAPPAIRPPSDDAAAMMTEVSAATQGGIVDASLPREDNAKLGTAGNSQTLVPPAAAAEQNPKMSAAHAQPNTGGATSLASSGTGAEEPFAADINPSMCRMDIVLVLDASGSLRQRFEHQKEMAAQLLDFLSPDIGEKQGMRIGLVKYSGKGKARVKLPLRNRLLSLRAIQQLIRAQQYSGGTTYTNEALQKALQELVESSSGGGGGPSPPSQSQQQSRRQVVAVFTDGMSQEDPGPGARALQVKGVITYAIAVEDGQPINKRELELIAGKPGRVFTNKNFETLKQEFRDLATTKRC